MLGNHIYPLFFANSAKIGAKMAAKIGFEELLGLGELLRGLKVLRNSHISSPLYT